MSSIVEAWRGRSRSGRGRRPALPSGMVTFLFTDIEGSTRLLQTYGRRYAELLADHRRRIRAAIVAHAGVETDTIGDALFAAFPHAPHAVAAALEAQAALATGPVRVRIGLHTGNPLLTKEGYVGLDVHRAARITAAGHGGQVLLSQPTRDLVDVDVRDLGEHRLKDLPRPERIYQLGDVAFAALVTLGRTDIWAERSASPAGGRGASRLKLAVTLPAARPSLQLTAPARRKHTGGVYPGQSMVARI